MLYPLPQCTCTTADGPMVCARHFGAVVRRRRDRPRGMADHPLRMGEARPGRFVYHRSGTRHGTITRAAWPYLWVRWHDEVGAETRVSRSILVARSWSKKAKGA